MEELLNEIRKQKQIDEVDARINAMVPLANLMSKYGLLDGEPAILANTLKCTVKVAKHLQKFHVWHFTVHELARFTAILTVTVHNLKAKAV